jgi:hypothetical protein
VAELGEKILITVCAKLIENIQAVVAMAADLEALIEEVDLGAGLPDTATLQTMLATYEAVSIPSVEITSDLMAVRAWEP